MKTTMMMMIDGINSIRVHIQSAPAAVAIRYSIQLEFSWVDYIPIRFATFFLSLSSTDEIDEVSEKYGRAVLAANSSAERFSIESSISLNLHSNLILVLFEPKINNKIRRNSILFRLAEWWERWTLDDVWTLIYFHINTNTNSTKFTEIFSKNSRIHNHQLDPTHFAFPRHRTSLCIKRHWFFIYFWW